MKTKISTKKETDTTSTLNGKDIIYMLRALGKKVPDNAKVTFRVPGGADWRRRCDSFLSQASG